MEKNISKTTPDHIIKHTNLVEDIRIIERAIKKI